MTDIEYWISAAQDEATMDDGRGPWEFSQTNSLRKVDSLGSLCFHRDIVSCRWCRCVRQSPSLISSVLCRCSYSTARCLWLCPRRQTGPVWDSNCQLAPEPWTGSADTSGWWSGRRYRCTSGRCTSSALPRCPDVHAPQSCSYSRRRSASRYASWQRRERSLRPRTRRRSCTCRLAPACAGQSHGCASETPPGGTSDHAAPNADDSLPCKYTSGCIQPPVSCGRVANQNHWSVGRCRYTRHRNVSHKSNWHDNHLCSRNPHIAQWSHPGLCPVRVRLFVHTEIRCMSNINTGAIILWHLQFTDLHTCKSSNQDLSNEFASCGYEWNHWLTESDEYMKSRFKSYIIILLFHELWADCVWPICTVCNRLHRNG